MPQAIDVLTLKTFEDPPGRGQQAARLAAQTQVGRVRVLGQIVREKGWLTLEDAIRRMTSFPAARFGLTDRGLIKKGLVADLVIFDPTTVRDQATWENPRLAPVGIHHVFVNGTQVVENGQVIKDQFAGQILRRTRQG